MIKVFIHPTKEMYYVNNPADGFQMRVHWTAVLSSDPVTGGPSSFAVMSVLDFPLTSSPAEVFGAAYAAILAECAARGWETPEKADIYAWMPTDFQTLMGNG
jgi:hypothetical protein